MKTLAIILLIAANSVLSAQTPTPRPTLPPLQTYSGGFSDGCNPTGQGPVIKDSPGTITTIHAGGSIPQTVFGYLLFNKTTAPLNGDVPAIAIPWFNSIGSVDRDYPGGLPMTTGISWAVSSSPSRLLVVPTVCSPMTLTVTYK